MINAPLLVVENITLIFQLFAFILVLSKERKLPEHRTSVKLQDNSVATHIQALLSTVNWTEVTFLTDSLETIDTEGEVYVITWLGGTIIMFILNFQVFMFQALL